jgi:Zn ribbon nucleic-acid-binding protein
VAGTDAECGLRPDDEAVLVRAANAQVRHNVHAWGELQAQGMEDGTELGLTFVFRAPGQVQATGLAGYLRGETDYEVHVRRQGRIGKREWFVVGATRPAPMSLDTLNRWSEWMIAAGVANGPCAFDGWAPREREMA